MDFIMFANFDRRNTEPSKVDYKIMPDTVGRANDFYNDGTIELKLEKVHFFFFNRIKEIYHQGQKGGSYFNGREQWYVSGSEGYTKKVLVAGHTICETMHFTAKLPFIGEVSILFNRAIEYDAPLPNGAVMFCDDELALPKEHFDLSQSAGRDFKFSAVEVVDGFSPKGDSICGVHYGKGGARWRYEYAEGSVKIEKPIFTYNSMYGSAKQGRLHLLINGEVVSNKFGHIDNDDRVISSLYQKGVTQYQIAHEPTDLIETLYETEYYDNDSLASRGYVLDGEKWVKATEKANGNSPFADFFKNNKFV